MKRYGYEVVRVIEGRDAGRLGAFITRELAQALVDFTPAEAGVDLVVVPCTVGVCRVCGCTDERACPGGCTWIEPDLCSACDGAEPGDDLD